MLSVITSSMDTVNSEMNAGKDIQSWIKLHALHAMRADILPRITHFWGHFGPKIPHFCRDFEAGIEERQFKIEEEDENWGLRMRMMIEEVLRMIIRIRIENWGLRIKDWGWGLRMGLRSRTFVVIFFWSKITHYWGHFKTLKMSACGQFELFSSSDSSLHLSPRQLHLDTLWLLLPSSPLNTLNRYYPWFWSSNKDSRKVHLFLNLKYFRQKSLPFLRLH